ncbi:MAG: GNAT family N-acetyltransferase [Planctomycetota bacterium]|jgi:RimJ/RimL family protein N-acetyltransferase|nr:GNAT family N-acetyltransferase [Planctomycetota bacterium]MDP6762277.1 GNAT family N-acetyltransferase [Planctomycetota bacterium]MDP6990013.1 GNAT family N-acetyltransferase [Planctomycetota bacterium]
MVPPGPDRDPSPAYRVETERLTLRCYQPEDAERLHSAVAQSREHLLPWMPWAADEPQDISQKVQLIRGFRGRFDLGEDFVYGLFERSSEELVGGCGLHPRCGPGGLEMGYWVRVDRIGEGFATEAAAAMTRVAIELERVEFVEISCDPANERSAAVPRKLGFTSEGVLRARLPWPGGVRKDKQTWSLLAEDYAASPCASAVLDAFDVIGGRLI